MGVGKLDVYLQLARPLMKIGNIQKNAQLTIPSVHHWIVEIETERFKKNIETALGTLP